MFGKSDRRGSPPPPQAATPAKPSEPPPRVKYDRGEKRKYVRDIVDVRGPAAGVMEVLLKTTGEWTKLTKAQIDVRAVLSNFRYGAGYQARSFLGKEPRYGRRLMCDVTLRGFDLRSPLLAFPPYEKEGDEQGAWGIYTMTFRDVWIFPDTEAVPVTEDAKLLVKIWDNEAAYDEYTGQLSDKYQAAKAAGQPLDAIWPTFVLNTQHSHWRRRDPDGIDVRSTIHLPPVVFDGLLADIVSMGPKLTVGIQIAIEAFVSGWGRNYGYGDYGSNKWVYDLALIPEDSVLTADVDHMWVDWRADEKTHDWETGSDIRRRETYLDNPDPQPERDDGE